jgi:hypothetical protein
MGGKRFIDDLSDAERAQVTALLRQALKKPEPRHAQEEDLLAAIFGRWTSDDQRQRTEAHLAQCKLCTCRVEGEIRRNPLAWRDEHQHTERIEAHLAVCESCRMADATHDPRWQVKYKDTKEE